MATILTWAPWQPGRDPMDRVWRWIRLLGLLYLTVCVVLIARMSGWPGSALPEVRVPDAVGLSRDVAYSAMQRLGLIPHIQEGERSDGYAQDAVMRQSLPPGMSVRAGRGIYLLICPGPLHVILPDLRRLDSDQASTAIARLGLQPSIAANMPSADVPFDSVVEQAPAPGVRVEYGSPVALVLSNGPPDNPVPVDGDPSMQSPGATPSDPGLPDPTAALPQAPSTIPLGGPDPTSETPGAGSAANDLDPGFQGINDPRSPQVGAAPINPPQPGSPLSYTPPSPARHSLPNVSNDSVPTDPLTSEGVVVRGART